MASTVDYENNTCTESQSERFSSESVTTPTPVTEESLFPYLITTAIFGILGAFGNGIVLVGFWLSRRSKMTSSMFYIANQTTLELFSCIAIAINMIMDAAGELKYNDSGPAATAKCILVDGRTLIVLGLNGSTAILVIMTLDRYWKIVHAIHHRNHYRRWMLRLGLFLPWLNGVATHLLPALGTTRVSNGKCMPNSRWPHKAMERGYGVFMFLWQFVIPLIVFLTAYRKIFKVVKHQGKVGTDGAGKASNQPVAGTSRGTTHVAMAPEGIKGKQVSKGPQGVGPQGGQKKLSQTQINVVKTMIYITVCFILCWMPMYIYVVLTMFGIASRFEDAASRIIVIVAYCQIFFDPLIYISRYEVVRRSLTGFMQKVTATVTQQTTTSSIAPS